MARDTFKNAKRHKAAGKRRYHPADSAPAERGAPVAPFVGPVEARPPFTLRVGEELQGAMLDRALRSHMPDASWNQIRSYIRQGKALVDGQTVSEPTFVLELGRTVEFQPKARRARDEEGMARWRMIYQDSQLVVVDKPSGLCTVPFEESERSSLDQLLSAHLGKKGRPTRVHVVHRLDKGTSGLLVFARTDAALKHLKNQFRFHTSHRRYEALVEGHAHTTTYESRLIADRGDGRRGSVQNPLLGRLAITHVKLIEHLLGASHIECTLETGRTHQIRIHLAEAGFPLLGERVYAPSDSENTTTIARVMLHAKELGFVHPTTGESLHFRSPAPPDFEQLLTKRKQDRVP